MKNSLRAFIASQILTAILLVTAGLFLVIGPVGADTYTPSEPDKDILIDKMVGVPRDDNGTIVYDYYDNLTSSNHLFRANDYVYFRLRVKNTSDATLTDVIVKDFAPGYFTLYENPGTVSDNTLSISAGDFAPGEEKTYIIRGRIYHDNNVPTGTTCVINRARAEDDGIVDEDTSQFCFNKTGTVVADGEDVKGAKTVPVPGGIPSTGAADGVLIAGLAMLFGAIGYKLRRISPKKHY